MKLWAIDVTLFFVLAFNKNRYPINVILPRESVLLLGYRQTSLNLAHGCRKTEK